MARRSAVRYLPLLLVLASVVVASFASAHANYLASEPARRARLAEAPGEVFVTLSEAIDAGGSTLEVRDGQGNRVDDGSLRISGGATPVLRVGLLPGLGDGAYKASWKALSSVDGHITSGSWGFAVGGAEPPAEEAASASPWEPGSAAARATAYAGYALALGSLAFLAWVEPRPLRAPRVVLLVRAYAVGATLVLAGTLLLTGHTAWKSGLGFGGFLATGVGHEFLFRVGAGLAGAAVAGWGLARPGGSARWRAAAGGFTLIAAAGNSLFVHSADQGWWAVGIDWVHLVSVSVWLGALGLFLHFIVAAYRAGATHEVRPAGRRFSRVALASVTLLGASGLASTVLILGLDGLSAPGALLRAPYGGILAAKLAVFGLMVGLAGVNRFVFLGERPGRDSGPAGKVDILAPAAGRRGRVFTRTVATEAALGIGVLVLAGFLTSLSPPLPVAAAASSLEALELAGHGTDHNATLRLDPAPFVGGDSNVTLRIEEAATGAPLEEAVRVRITIAAVLGNATGGESWSAVPDGGGLWVVGPVLFAQAGPHEASVEVQTETVYLDVIRMAFNVSASAPGLAVPIDLGATEYDVYLHENPFHVAPGRIQARVGEEIVLHVQNAGNATHDLLICRSPAGSDCAETWGNQTPLLPAGARVDVPFTPTEVGTYEYYCTIPGHREAGMRGTLEVAGDELTAESPGPSPAMLLLAPAVVAIAARRARR